MKLPIHYQELEAIYARTLGAGVRSLAMVAAEPGVGVTLLATALARRSAASGRRTLLVELNLLHPCLAEQFGVERRNWLPDDPSALSEIVATGGNGFDLLPAPAEGKQMLRFREQDLLARALSAWLKKYQVVIFDTSPLNAVNHGNIPAERVSASCEATLLTVLTCHSREAEVRSAVAKLKDAGAELIGTVLNDRFAPRLVDELCRETHRLDPWNPELMHSVRRFFRNSAFLNRQS